MEKQSEKFFKFLANCPFSDLKQELSLKFNNCELKFK